MFFPRGSGTSGGTKKASSQPGAGGGGGAAGTLGEGGSGAAGDGGATDENFSDRVDGKKGDEGISSVEPAQTEEEKKAAKEALGSPDELGECDVEIEMDPSNPECGDDRYVLRSADGKYEKVMTVKDDMVPGDKLITLKFTDFPGGTSYTMEIDPGAEGEPYKLFEDVPFKKLATIKAKEA